MKLAHRNHVLKVSPNYVQIVTGTSETDKLLEILLSAKICKFYLSAMMKIFKDQ